ncbi:MAG: bifunctional precorrin-2 dehydrogenase/sirohydrochlorin ferrochelatase, partial [Acidobacteriota bacterium]
VLMVGAGPVAASKLATLVPTGARLVVVAPDICADIRHTPNVELRMRPFQPSDLDGVCLVVAAATPAVNRTVAELAEPRGLFVNAVDDPSNASAYLGGVLRRGGLTIALSTDGRAPALAGLLREGLDQLLPADLDAWFDRADEMKQRWRAQGVPMAERRPQLAEALLRLYPLDSSPASDHEGRDAGRVSASASAHQEPAPR